MCRVDLSKNGSTYMVKAEGHATGSSAVCAAVSVLMYSLLGYLDNTDARIIQTIVDETVPIFQVEWESYDDAGQAVYDLVSIGFLEMEESYNKYISVFVGGA